MGNIIDLSHHQAPSSINYDKLAKDTDLVIIRVQYGSNTIDNHYKTHFREFQKRNVPTACYAWVRGVSQNDMRQEAKDFYKRAKAYKPTFWFLDLEEKSMSNMRKGAEAFRKKLKKLGTKKVGAYIAHHLYNELNINTKKFDAVWIPRYGQKPDYKCDLHQYSESGHLNGYSGNLDLNKIISNRKLKYFTNGKNKKKKSKKKLTGKSYTVKKGDTLSEIAQKYGTTTGKLKKANGLQNTNQIYVGEKLKIRGKKTKTYTVKSGDTLSQIAVNHNTTTGKLKKKNNIANVNAIQIGQKLKV